MQIGEEEEKRAAAADGGDTRGKRTTVSHLKPGVRRAVEP